MKDIKQQFEDFRTNTPKHIQWLLLGVAFVVVIILLTLLLTHKSANKNITENANQTISFEFTPDKIEFNDIKVGDFANRNINVKVNTPVVIKSVTVIGSEDLEAPNNCTDFATDECIINVIYTPKSETKKVTGALSVKWHTESQDKIIKTEEIPILFSAYEEKIIKPEPKPVVVPKPEPVVEEEPVFEDDVIEEDDYDDDPYIITEPVEEIKTIATPNPFTKDTQDVLLPPEKCSEFAIPGYDASGRQIGWIKPEHGANYFHPFSDKDCSKPTGIYDMSTGVITSLTDGSKIGTDSDHIGYRNVRNRNLSVPRLNMPDSDVSSDGEFSEDAVWIETGNDVKSFNREKRKDWELESFKSSAPKDESVVSTRPYNRTFILRQFKPIPATIVSEVRADPSVYGCNGTKCDPNKNYSIPVRATVDRNVYSDDGRTIILPTGTLLMGYLDGNLPGPYQAFGRMNIKWYQFIRPDGVEFNFNEDGQDPYSADAQGRMGVPGHGSTDYVEQMVMPILTALVPAAVNMIAPITDTVINQIDLDNNTVVQSGTIRSSEMAKQDIINTWNKITQKLLVDAIDNTVPPFSIAAGTRINVFSPVDLVVTCGEDGDKKCSFGYGDNRKRKWSDLKAKVDVNKEDSSWVGQVRSFDLSKYCEWNEKKNKVTIKEGSSWTDSGYDYRTVLAYCESQNYQAVNNAKQDAYNKQVQQQAADKRNEYGAQWTADDGWTTNFDNADQEKAYNTEVLGLTYDDNGNIEDPFAKPSYDVVDEGLTCDDGSAPDADGCCPGETFTDMGEAGWNCCPDTGGDCFPPITFE